MKNFFTYLGFATAFTLMLFVCSFSNAATFYFSSSLGDDARSVAQAQNENTPWKSIQKLNSIFSTLQPGDNILFKNGDTFQGTISISKSGTAGAPISFGSYGSGEKPIITSLVTVSNWISKGGNIYEASVGVADALNIVLMDGKAQAMGRFPNAEAIKKGYLTISSTSGGNIVSSELQAPANFTGGEVVIRKNNWIIDRHYIDQHSGTSITYNTTGSKYYPKVGFGFFIQNHAGTLDQNGEWFFNKQNKTLQIYYDRGNPSSANIQVALNNLVIDINSAVSNIAFSNLSILGANENLVNLSSSSNISFTSSELKFAGRNGINAVSTTNFSIQNSLVEDMYNSGLFFKWQDVNMKILNNTFNRTHVFPGMGRNGDLNGNTIYMSETSGNGLVENNKILNSGYQGVNFNGNNTVIKNNLVDTFCFVKDDGAGIYTYTGSSNITLTNRKVINNIVINGIGAVDGTKPYGPNDFPYVEGIYMDDNSTGVEIRGNTVANVASSGIYIHNSRSIDIIQNNIYNVGNSILLVHDNLGNANRNINMNNNNFLAKTIKQAHVFVRSKLDDVAQMGVFDQNVYSRPVNESNTINLRTPAKNGLIDLQTWKDSYGLDKTSTKSPVAFDPNKMSIDEFILFDYNYSNSSKSLPLSGTYVDLKGKILTGSITVPAYSSVLLLKTEAGAPLENVAPTVSITAPAANAQFIQGDNISITANAADSDGTIAKVDFFNGSTLLGTDTTSPYSYTWSNVPVGSFSLTAKANDDKGTVTASAPVSINVVEKPNVAPTVSITGPAANAQFTQGDNVSITANAADSDGTISKVDFFNGTTLLGTDTTSPYSYTWSNVPVGSFSLTAKANDDKGTVTASAPVSINVVEKPNVAPTVSITGPAANAQFTQGDNVSITANAADSDGTITKVDFFNGTTLLGTDTTSPYSFAWTNLSTGSFTLTAKATDNLGTATVSDGVNINVVAKVNVAPTVSITGPTANAQFIQGDNVSITANAADSDGTISKVDFFNGSTLLGTDTTSPYSYTWSNVPVGTFSLTAKANDDKGTVTASVPVSINVIEKPNAAPTVSITAPSANAQFTQGDNVSITANAADSDGTISKVDFFNGSTLLGTDTTSPYSYTWSNVPAGTFSLTAKANDDKGTVTVSAPVSISVSEKDSEETPIEAVIPEPIIVTPINNQEFESGEIVEVIVMFQGSEESVKKVEYYSGNQLLGYSAISPFTFTWQNPVPGQHIITTKAIGIDLNNYKTSKPVTIIVKEKIQKIFQITNPIRDAEFFQGTPIPIIVEIPEINNPISKVEYFRGNVKIGSSISAPFNYTWNNAPKGVHNLVAQLVYENGTIILSNPIPIVVLSKNQPIVKLISPNNNRVVQSGENLDLNVELLEFNTKVDSVEYYLDGKKLGSSGRQPYDFQWRNIPEGDHEISAHAVDASGLQYYSEPITFSVIKENLNPQLEYVIGPNPTTEHLNVIFSNLDGIYDIEFRVVSMNGDIQKIFQATPEVTTTIDVSDLINGVYILQLTSNGKNISSKKFIKK